MTALLEQIPKQLSGLELIHYIQNTDIDWSYLELLKAQSNLSDQVIASWLNISEKTFRQYKKGNQPFKPSIQERILLLLSLTIHGKEVFGTAEEFVKWLTSENFFFDGKQPISFLDTVTGIRFVNERLTAMEMGDNV